MDHTEAQTLLRSLINVSIDAAGKSEEDLAIADLLELTLQSYEAPCSDCNRNDAGGVLLFKCDLWDWGQGECLAVDFVRQFSVNDFNGDLEQLHATLHYPAELAADKDVAASLCSAGCASLAALCQQVTEPAAYRLTETVRPGAEASTLEILNIPVSADDAHDFNDRPQIPKVYHVIADESETNVVAKVRTHFTDLRTVGQKAAFGFDLLHPSSRSVGFVLGDVSCYFAEIGVGVFGKPQSWQNAFQLRGFSASMASICS